MKTAIVLAMHGMPPSDFPPWELRELMALHARLKASPQARGRAANRYAQLDRKIRRWPRTKQNDLFYATSQNLARMVSGRTGCLCFAGFNEFCRPTLKEALDAAAAGSGRVTVLTPMMTRGGSHSEIEIPRAVDLARRRYPRVKFQYLWPFPLEAIADFLAERLKRGEDPG